MVNLEKTDLHSTEYKMSDSHYKTDMWTWIIHETTHDQDNSSLDVSNEIHPQLTGVSAFL